MYFFSRARARGYPFAACETRMIMIIMSLRMRSRNIINVSARGILPAGVVIVTRQKSNGRMDSESRAPSTRRPIHKAFDKLNMAYYEGFCDDI